MASLKFVSDVLNKVLLNTLGSITHLIILFFFLTFTGLIGLNVIEAQIKHELSEQLSLILNTNVTATTNWIKLRKFHAMGWANNKESHNELLDLIAVDSQGIPKLLGSAELSILRERFEPICDINGFLDFLVINKSGMIIGAKHDDVIGRDDMVTLSDFISRSLSGETLVSRPFLTHSSVQNTAHSPHAVMFVSTPIIDAGEVVGVLAFSLNLQEFTRTLESARSGDTGETYAFDVTGLMLSDSRFNDQLKEKGLIPNIPESRAMLTITLNVSDYKSAPKSYPIKGNMQLTRMASAATKGLSGIDVDGYHDYRGVPVIGAWTWLSEHGFGVATEIDSHEAFNVLSKLRALFLALYALLIAAISLNLISRRRELLAEQARLLILNSAGEGIYGLDTKGLFTFINPAAEIMLQYPANELIGKSAHAVLHHTRRDGSPCVEGMCSTFRALHQGLIYQDSNEIFWKKDGTYFPVDFTSTPILNDGSLQGTVVLFKDISDRKAVEQLLENTNTYLDLKIKERTFELSQANERLRKLSRAAEQSPSSIIITDTSGQIEYVNPKFTLLSGYTMEEVVGKTPRILKSGKTTDREYKELWGTLKSGNEWRGEFMNKRKNGDVFWGSASISPIKDAKGKITHYISSMEDITKRKQDEDKLRGSLLEKEVLMREINHRSKNNMQIISSLIKMQSASSGDPRFVSLARNLNNRISSMNLIHDQIFNSEEINSINVGKYISSLARNTLSSFGESTGRIELSTHINNIYLDFDTSIYCGLIINELVSNSLKHAFQPEQNGWIDILIQQIDDGPIELIVRDNGVGISADLDIHSVKSLGMKLITSLAEVQLRGTITISNENGTEFIIRFPAPINS